MYANVHRITFIFVIQQLIPILVFLFVTQTAPKTLGDGRTEALHKAAVEKVIATHVFLSSHFFHSIVQHASVNFFCTCVCSDSSVSTT